MEGSKLNDQTSLGINLKWLIQIIAVAAMAVWGYFGLTSKISQLEIDVLRMKDSVTMNSEFRVKWIKVEWFDKVLIGFGWLVLSPFIIAELVVMGFQWLTGKIKRKK